MSFAQSIIYYFLVPVISAYIFIIFVYVIMGWLISFGVINMRNQNVRQIYLVLERAASFTLDPIRKIIPPLGGLDFSPLIVFFGLQWFSGFVLMQKLFPVLG